MRFRRCFVGLLLAIIAFNRWSRFLQAILRRIAIVLFSLYFDDATFQDFAAMARSAQAAVRGIACALGSPFSKGNSQDVVTLGDSLRLLHDLFQVRVHGHVSFWIRPRLSEKIRWPLSHSNSPQAWHASFTDVLAFSVMLRLAGLPVQGSKRSKAVSRGHRAVCFADDLKASFQTILFVLASEHGTSPAFALQAAKSSYGVRCQPIPPLRRRSRGPASVLQRMSAGLRHQHLRGCHPPSGCTSCQDRPAGTPGSCSGHRHVCCRTSRQSQWLVRGQYRQPYVPH